MLVKNQVFIKCVFCDSKIANTMTSCREKSEDRNLWDDSLPENVGKIPQKF